MRDLYAELISAAHSGSFGLNGMAHPTPEQLRAGNYKKGRVNLHGMTIAIETPQGQRRMGKTDGKPWSVICMAHYGYIVGTKASDGDAIDVYVGPVPESQKVWVVNQNDKAGNFDEVKVLLGFHDEQSARSAYMNSYERGWQGLGSLVACSLDQFRWWLKFGDTTKPLTDRALPHDGTNEMNETVWDSAANPVGCTTADLIYRLRGEDQDGLLLDAVTVNDILEDSDGEMALDALVVQYNRVERKAEQLRRIMESAGGEIKPVSVQITPPFKQRGTTNVVIVYELSDGQTVSVWMHNPDSTPNRIKPDDELVSWAWRLNKKDVSIIVAPEKGQDLNPREVSRRIMRLAEKNSARFAKANAGRAARMENIEAMKSDVTAKEATLAALDAEHEELTVKVTAKRNRVPATLQGTTQGADTDIEMNSQTAATLPPSTVRNQAVKAALSALGWNTTPSNIEVMVTIDRSVYSLKSSYKEARGSLVSVEWADTGARWTMTDDLSKSAAEFASDLDKAYRQAIADARKAVTFDPTTPEGYAQISDDQAALEANQDQLDSFFQGRLIAVRNALRDLGWDGERHKPLSKNGYALKPIYKQVGAGANIVGMHYEIEGVTGYFMSDDLTRTPEELADKINMGIPQANTAKPYELTVNGAALTAEGEKSASTLKTSFSAASQLGSATDKDAEDMRIVEAARRGASSSIAYLNAYGELHKFYMDDRYTASARTSDDDKDAFKAGILAMVAQLEDLRKAALGDLVVAPQSLESVARPMIPAEFKSIGFDGEGFNFVAADGLGIRLKSGPRGQVLGYLVEGYSYDSLGSRGNDPVQIKDLVDTALGLIEDKRGDMVIMQIIGKDAVVIGKTRFESGNGGFYSTGRNSKPLTAAMLAEDGGSFELDDYALLRQAGSVTITSVGSENVYFSKGGVPYFTKVLNTDDYQAGQVVDLSGVEEPAHEPTPKPAVDQALVDGVEAILKSTGWAKSATPGVWDRGSWQVVMSDAEPSIRVNEYAESGLVSRGDIPLQGDEGAIVKQVEQLIDANRVPEVPDEDPEQAKYSKFNRSAIKMPTAVQLGMNTRGNPILITYKDQEGWSNGHILALHKPKVLTDAIAKYHVDESNLRRLSEDAVSRVVPRDATLKVEPIALYESTENGSKSTVSALQRKDAVKVKAVVLSSESAGLAVPVDARYFGYFDKQFKQPDYFVSRDGSGAVVVKKAGEVVGLMMPIKGTDGMLKRAAKAAGGADPVAQPSPEPAKPDFTAWEEAFYAAIEEQGEMSRSDAQGVAEAQGDMMNDQFAAGASPEAAAAAVLAAGSVGAVDDFAAEDAALSALGFKRVQGNDWASPSFPQENGGSKGFNVRASGDPTKYRLSFRVTFPGITGASQDVGTYDSLDALMAAVSEELAKAGGDDSAAEAKAFLNDVIAGNVDYMDEALADRLKAIYSQYEGDADMQALLEKAANAYSEHMIKEARAALA